MAAWLFYNQSQWEIEVPLQDFTRLNVGKCVLEILINRITSPIKICHLFFFINYADVSLCVFLRGGGMCVYDSDFNPFSSYPLQLPSCLPHAILWNHLVFVVRRQRIKVFVFFGVCFFFSFLFLFVFFFLFILATTVSHLEELATMSCHYYTGGQVKTLASNGLMPVGLISFWRGSSCRARLWILESGVHLKIL